MSVWICYARSKLPPDAMERWVELNVRIHGRHPLLDGPFMSHLLKCFGDGREHLCVLVEEDGPSVGQWLAGLWLTRTAVGQWRTFMPAQTQLGVALLTDVTQLNGLYKALPGPAWMVDLLCQDPQLLDMASVNAWQAEVRGHALTIAIPLEGGFISYWDSRQSKLKQNMRRYARKLADSGQSVGFRVHSSHEDIATAVERYGVLEASGWKGKLGTALSPESEQFVFFQQVMQTKAGMDEAIVFELWFDEHLVASRLVLTGPGHVVFLKTSYDENYAEYSPGRLLLYRVIEYLFGNYAGRQLYFYTNADHDLLAWSVETRDIQHVTIFRSPLIRDVYSLLKTLAAMGRRRSQARSDGDEDVQLSRYAHPQEFPADVTEFMNKAEGLGLEFGANWFRLQVESGLAEGEQAYFHVLRMHGRVMVVLPIKLRLGSFGDRDMGSLVNCYSSIYAPLMLPGFRVSTRSLALLVDRMRRDYAGSSRWTFAPMDYTAPAFQLLTDALRMAGLVPVPFYHFGNWYLPKQNWNSYWQGRDSQLHHTVNRRGKKFSERGGRMEILTEASEIEAGIAAYQQVYASSWKKAEPFVEFIPNLMRSAAASGWLRLGVAWLDGKPIAAQIWLVGASKASIFKLAYDESVKDLSAGTLLSAKLFEHVLQTDGVREIDYLIGDDVYKKSWMTHRRERWGIVAYNPRTVRGFAGLVRALFGRCVRAWLPGLRESIRSIRRSSNT